MKGRTKSFFEDLVVLLFLVIAVGFIYNYFFNNEVKSTQKQQQSSTIQTPQTIYHHVEETPAKKIEQSVEENETQNTISEETQNISQKTDSDEQDKKILQEKKEEKEVKEIKSEQTTQKNIEEKLQTSAPIEDENIEENELKKEVDLRVLRKFLKDLKTKIKDKIDLSSLQNTENNFLSIRITVLKDGSYEQLTFIGGNKIIYDNNVSNINSIFPIIVDEKIVADFPRYIRYKFEFTQNEQ